MSLTPLSTLGIVVIAPAIYVAIVAAVVLYRRKLDKTEPS